MKTIYAIRDRVAQALVGNAMYILMAFRTDQEATRYFADAILDEKSILNKHPADYELIKCGRLHDNGDLEPDQQPNNIVITGDAIIGLASPQLVKES